MTHVSIDSVDMEFPPGRVSRTQEDNYDWTPYVMRGIQLRCVPPSVFNSYVILRACAPTFRKLADVQQSTWRVCDMAIVNQRTLLGYLHGTFWYNHYGAHSRCVNCFQAYMAHLDNGRCLFEASYFARQTGYLYHYNVVNQVWGPVNEVPR